MRALGPAAWDSQGPQPVGPQEMHYQSAPVEEYLLALLPWHVPNLSHRRLVPR